MATTKPDLTEFVQLGSRDQRRACRVATGLALLTDGDRAKAEAALLADADVITSGAIEKWFAARDLRVPIAALTHHRRGRCRCADAQS